MPTLSVALSHDAAAVPLVAPDWTVASRVVEVVEHGAS